MKSLPSRKITKDRDLMPSVAEFPLFSTMSSLMLDRLRSDRRLRGKSDCRFDVSRCPKRSLVTLAESFWLKSSVIFPSRTEKRRTYFADWPFTSLRKYRSSRIIEYSCNCPLVTRSFSWTVRTHAKRLANIFQRKQKSMFEEKIYTARNVCHRRELIDIVEFSCIDSVSWTSRWRVSRPLVWHSAMKKQTNRRSFLRFSLRLNRKIPKLEESVVRRSSCAWRNAMIDRSRRNERFHSEESNNAPSERPWSVSACCLSSGERKRFEWTNVRFVIRTNGFEFEKWTNLFGPSNFHRCWSDRSIDVRNFEVTSEVNAISLPSIIGFDDKAPINKSKWKTSTESLEICFPTVISSTRLTFEK